MRSLRSKWYFKREERCQTYVTDRYSPPVRNRLVLGSGLVFLNAA